MELNDHHTAMRHALQEAIDAAARDEVPIGAVLVDTRTGEILAKNGNRTRELADPTAHAEILVIREECAKRKVQRLDHCRLYVTLEPCPQCAAAISFARIETVVFGADDPKSGGVVSGPQLYTHPQLHHKPEVISGILAQDCGKILSDFFAKKRHDKAR